MVRAARVVEYSFGKHKKAFSIGGWPAEGAPAWGILREKGRDLYKVFQAFFEAEFPMFEEQRKTYLHLPDCTACVSQDSREVSTASRSHLRCPGAFDCNAPLVGGTFFQRIQIASRPFALTATSRPRFAAAAWGHWRSAAACKRIGCGRRSADLPFRRQACLPELHGTPSLLRRTPSRPARTRRRHSGILRLRTSWRGCKPFANCAGGTRMPGHRRWH